MGMPDWATCSRRKRHRTRTAPAHTLQTPTAHTLQTPPADIFQTPTANALRTTVGNGLNVSLRLLQKAVTGIGVPGVESAVNGIVGVIELINDVQDSAEDLRDLRGLLATLANAISMAPNLHPEVAEVPTLLRSRIDEFLLSLHRMLMEVNQRLGDTNVLVRAANSQAHKDAVVNITAKINGLLYQFNAQGTLSLELDVASARQDIRSVIQAQRALLTGQKALLTGQNAQEYENLINAIPRVHARYNDTSTKPSRPCHPGTRIDLLQTIRAWIYGGLDMTPYFWLCGEVGVGKTTVAHSVASENEALHLLGASFFFSRHDEQRRTPNLVFTSIAYQLARFDARIFKALAEVLKPDPDIVKRSPMEQFKRLVLQPLARSGLDPSQTVVIVIDGLDECTDPALILDVFTQGIDDAGVRLRVLISSRPYASILSKFHNPQLYQITSQTQFRDINPDVLSADVTAYLTWELGTLALRSGLPSPWPSQEELDELIRRTGGLFIIASSYSKYIDNPEVGSPVDQLRRILSRQRRVGSSPLAELDALYDQILDELKAKLPTDVVMARDILVFVIHGQGDISVQVLAGVLSVDSSDVKLVLRYLAAVIPLPMDDYAKIIPFHASFGEYIQDPTRCTIQEFIIEKQAAYGRMAIRCFDVIVSTADEGVIGVEYDFAGGVPWTPEPLSHVARSLSCYMLDSSPAQRNEATKDVTEIKLLVMINIISSIGSLDNCAQLLTAMPDRFKNFLYVELGWPESRTRFGGKPDVDPLREGMIKHYISEINQIAEKAVSMGNQITEVETTRHVRQQPLKFVAAGSLHNSTNLRIVRDVRCWAKYSHRNVMSFKDVNIESFPSSDPAWGNHSQVLVFVESPVRIQCASSLQKHLETSINVDVLSRIQLALGVADGLRYLHGSSPPQPHNTINPHQILVSSEGQTILYPPRWDLNFRPNLSSHWTNDVDIIPCEWKQNFSPPLWYHWNPIAGQELRHSLSARLQVDVWDFGSILYQVFTGEDPSTASHRLSGRSGVFDQDPGRQWDPYSFWTGENYEDRYEAAVSLLLDTLQASGDVKKLLKSCWTIGLRNGPPMSEVFNRLKEIVEAMEM